MEKIDWDEGTGTSASRRLASDGNLITTWKTLAKHKYGSLAKAYEVIENDVGQVATLNNFSRWERGVRRVPPVVANYMIRDVLIALLQESADTNLILKRIRLPEEGKTI